MFLAVFTVEKNNAATLQYQYAIAKASLRAWKLQHKCVLRGYRSHNLSK